ncbi:MAG TPA: type II secretion system F family protein [Actinocrinis sp.]|nr:type II secretion system F family protein [Actinocrinis sp.]
MIPVILCGGLVGFAVFVFIYALFPARRSAAGTVAQIDALRERGQSFGQPVRRERDQEAPLKEQIGTWLSDVYARQGWKQTTVRADLNILERPWETFLATKVGLAALGFFAIPILFALAWLLGLHLNVLIPLWLALLAAGGCFMLPDLEVRNEGKAKREDFRRVVGAYLDLVSMNLAGGRGLPEALMAAAELSDSPAIRRIRIALTDARLSGQTQWTALRMLGEQIGIEELQDLGFALALVADDGAKIRQSLSSRAETMRRRELAELESKAGARSQSMLVAQMLLCTAFLLFLMYPAVAQISAF